MPKEISQFEPDYRHLLAAAQNQRPARLPLYEHIISPKVMEKILGLAKYSKRIGLLGGIDVDLLCRNSPDRVYQIVLEKARKYRLQANGFALGSGNSIPDYVPIEGYLAMIKAAQAIRLEEYRHG